MENKIAKSILKKVLVSTLPMLLFLLVIFIPIFLISGENSSSNSGSAVTGTLNVSPEVEAYRPIVEQECIANGVPVEYVDVLLAIMMQESGGKGGDPMQSSESAGLEPGEITNPIQSIHYGVLHFKQIYEGIESKDLNAIVQGYNFGSAWISFINENGGVWTHELAEEYSTYWATQNGWDSYGDVDYVPHVLRYLAPPGSGATGEFQTPFPATSYVVTSEYGPRWGVFHYGIDLVAYQGAPVSSVAAGVVVDSRYSDSYGNVVTIDHRNGVFSRYAHLDRKDVAVGQEVTQGQVIGVQGNTGDSTGSHLHFEMRTANDYNHAASAKNPRDYIQFPPS